MGYFLRTKPSVTSDPKTPQIPRKIGPISSLNCPNVFKNIIRFLREIARNFERLFNVFLLSIFWMNLGYFFAKIWHFFKKTFPYNRQNSKKNENNIRKWTFLFLIIRVCSVCWQRYQLAFDKTISLNQTYFLEMGKNINGNLTVTSDRKTPEFSEKIDLISLSTSLELFKKYHPISPKIARNFQKIVPSFAGNCPTSFGRLIKIFSRNIPIWLLKNS